MTTRRLARSEMFYWQIEHFTSPRLPTTKTALRSRRDIRTHLLRPYIAKTRRLSVTAAALVVYCVSAAYSPSMRISCDKISTSHAHSIPSCREYECGGVKDVKVFYVFEGKKRLDVSGRKSRCRA
jgi:hypothetical protein